MIPGTHPRWNEGRSIHIGVDEVDASVYREHLEPLAAAERDAAAMRDLATAVGVSTRLIVGEDATRKNVVESLEATIERLVPGDFLAITFAGHGVSLRGAGDDPDGFDEAWCLHDGLLLDDELALYLSTVPAGCEVAVVTDACFAAGVLDGQDEARRVGAPAERGRTRLPPSQAGTGTLSDGGTVDFGDFDSGFLDAAGVKPGDFVIARGPATRGADRAISQLLRSGVIPPGPVRFQPGEVRAEVVSLAAAAEGELAYEGPKHGLFTAALITLFDRIELRQLTYADLIDIARAIVPVQTATIGSRAASRQTVHFAPALARGVTTLAVPGGNVSVDDPGGQSEAAAP